MTKESDGATKVAEYDRWHEIVHGAENPAIIQLEQWHRSALTLSPPVEGLRILEVGCGVGDFSIHLARLGADVASVDFSPQAIKLAQKKANEQNVSVSFHVADAQLLPFKDCAFDLVFSCECLEHVPNPKIVLSELYRVLKSSGKLLLTTENYSNAMLLGWIVSWWRNEPFNSGAGVQPIEHFFLFWRVRRMFKVAGFRVEKMIGSHHVFLLLPRFDPSTFVIERFSNPVASKMLFPFARHVAFAATKK